ncbi:hypothetical protein PAL_GLEAN10008983 [Pteropus alecto]|uniref:Uncharacterized protein n=1 Tax=Pteropus alecto TaxID=9402 RepID=L5KJI3_PTEAL|nr:hypothetical protein PAL_GLEAN10008983 [Pteropus alecto]
MELRKMDEDRPAVISFAEKTELESCCLEQREAIKEVGLKTKEVDRAFPELLLCPVLDLKDTDDSACACGP